MVKVKAKWFKQFVLEESAQRVIQSERSRGNSLGAHEDLCELSQRSILGLELWNIFYYGILELEVSKGVYL